MELFKKSVVIGVSVTPEVGLEVAQIDFATRTVLKYAVRPLEYDINRRDIADLDIFKETLSDLLEELQLPKGTSIVLNLPAVTFRVNDYPASLDEEQVGNAIEEELAENLIFKNNEPCIAATQLPNSTIQFNKIAYEAVQKTTIIEIAMAIKDLGYKLLAIDTSVNSILNSLILKERVNVENDVSWVLLLVENNCCRVISMNGRTYVDAFEEKISIGEILGDAENYSTVISAVTPILKNLPSQYLCVVSKTNIVSAEILASKLNYSAPIIHQEANSFSQEVFMDVSPEVDEALAPTISLDVIGAALYRNLLPYSTAHFNLFNKSLGDIYLDEQPPEVVIAGHRIVLDTETLIKIFILCAIVILVPAIIAFIVLLSSISSQNSVNADLDSKIEQMNKFLKDNESVSADLFDEGDEIRVGLEHNKNVYSYYTIVGTEIPKKLWLTHLKFSDKTTIEGQADNLESVYAFFRSVKDYDPESDIKLQKLGLASNAVPKVIEKDAENSDNSDKTDDFEVDSILTSSNADFYEFRISNEPEVKKEDLKKKDENGNDLPDLEPIKENN
ncbi:hypothetical protein EGQ24_04510 [bacterium]|nr:hypothetical protein [bacterium]